MSVDTGSEQGQEPPVASRTQWRPSPPTARFVPALLPLLLVLLLAQRALGHGFGQRYDLPVPLSLYLIGAAAAVVLSFVVAALFLRTGGSAGSYPRLNLLRWRWGRALLSRPVGRVFEIASVAVFLLVLVAGIIGSPNQSRNIAPLLVWVIWWVGVAYASALLGDVWRLLNPWRIIYSWVEGLARRSDPAARISLDLEYPRRLGVWPAIVLFFTFAWLEIAFHDPARPSNIATMILVYSVITWTGMILFGKETWLKRGEAFTLVFGLLARFAPTEVRVTDPHLCSRCSTCHPPAASLDDSLDTSASSAIDRGSEGQLRGETGHDGWAVGSGGEAACINCYSCFEEAPREQREFNLRPFGAGLLHSGGVSSSLMVFVLLILSTVTFDGFTDTPVWASIVLGYYSTFGRITGVTTLGLLTFPLVFLALYLLTAALMPRVAGRRMPLLHVAKRFVLSLVPIALAYHLAHYLTYLLVQSQQLVPLASDPFGFGWDLFGTVGYSVDINVVGARFAWYTAVIAIVVGHIIAVWLAHLAALWMFRDHREALRSQYPMLVLMVLYTAASLWIMAQPIVEVAAPA